MIVGVLIGNDATNAYQTVIVEGRLAELAKLDDARRSEIARLDAESTLLERLRAAAPERLAVIDGDDASQSDTGSRGLLRRTHLFRLARALRYWSWQETHFVTASFADVSGRPGRVPFVLQPRLRTVFKFLETDALALDPSDARVREGVRITKDALDRIHAELPSGTNMLVALIPDKARAYASALRFPRSSQGLPYIPRQSRSGSTTQTSSGSRSFAAPEPDHLAGIGPRGGAAPPTVGPCWRARVRSFGVVQ